MLTCTLLYRLHERLTAPAKTILCVCVCCVPSMVCVCVCRACVDLNSGVVLVVCVCVGGVVLSLCVCVCVCDLLIFLPELFLYRLHERLTAPAKTKLAPRLSLALARHRRSPSVSHTQLIPEGGPALAQSQSSGALRGGAAAREGALVY